MSDPYALKIYTDGSSYRNPGHEAGLAGIAEFPEALNMPDQVIFQRGYLQSTNNRMELMGCIYALKYIIDNSSALKINRAIILSDSMYVYDHQFTCESWKKANWNNSAGKPIENADLWAEFMNLRRKTKVRVEIQWIAGKSNAITKEVDKLAKKAAKGAMLSVDSGYKPGKVSKTQISLASSSQLFPASGQQLEIRVYRYVRSNKQVYKVIFECALKDGQELEKYFAYLDTEQRPLLHRHSAYIAEFNSDPKFPQILKLHPQKRA